MEKSLRALIMNIVFIDGLDDIKRKMKDKRKGGFS